MSRLLNFTPEEKQFLATCLAARRASQVELIADAMTREELTLAVRALNLNKDLYVRLLESAQRDLKDEVRIARSGQ